MSLKDFGHRLHSGHLAFYQPDMCHILWSDAQGPDLQNKIINGLVSLLWAEWAYQFLFG